jgi:BirA family transcriptional regulator, biotin operon repressor / biotin---[acetyl-CoA-carboxylase] ligase
VVLLSPDVRLVHFEAIDSTNAEAERRAVAGERGPLWLVADRQSEGRGRRGRHWVSESGNLFATLLITLSVAPAIAAQLSFVAALAVLETIRPLLSQRARGELAVKWPNDVLLEGKKLAGILAETVATTAANELAVAIGCGVNLRHAPAHIRYAATCLARYGCRLDRDHLFAGLATAMAKQLTAWSEGRGFDVIRQCWLAQAAGLGGRARVDIGQGTTEGTFVNVAADGALILRLDDGEQRTIYGGEVTFVDIDRLRSRKP